MYACIFDQNKIIYKILFRYFLEFLYTCIQWLLCSAPVYCSGFIFDIWSGSLFQGKFLYIITFYIIAAQTLKLFMILLTQVRGGFLNEYRVASIATNKRIADEIKIHAEDQVTAKLFDPVPSTSAAEPLHMQQVNTSQLHQSRFGLLSQAFMLFIIVGFLFSETLSEFWKTK